MFGCTAVGIEQCAPVWQVPSLAAQPQTLDKEEQNALPHKGSKGSGSVTNEEKTREKGYMVSSMSLGCMERSRVRGSQLRELPPGLQMMYPHYDYEYLESIKPKHVPPEKVRGTTTHCARVAAT